MPDPTALNLTQRLDAFPEDDLFDLFLGWTIDQGIELYPAQEEAILEVFSGNHVILNTPTGSGKSMVALAMHFYSFARGERSYYTSPIKALVSEKFFSLCEHFGPENVGMLTGDASINYDAPIVCCTQKILAATALSEGDQAEVHHAVIDEFHYYADRDRGTAWQLPLLTLPQTVFLLMSATLGDTRDLAAQLKERTGRPVALVKSTDRPVPLQFDYTLDKIAHLTEELVHKGRAPVYIVNFTQRECAELAQSLMSVNYCSDQEKDAIKEALQGANFDTPYGKTVRKYLLHGIAIHHGGLLPKYRFLAEKLSQQGLLKIIVGTDTLGVGINMPLRTVVFTKLCKFDGRKDRLLSVREFQQIAGRAGRKGYDTQGYVIAQAPEHVIENEAAKAKLADNPKKLKKLRMKSPPDRGYVHWDEETFHRLYTSDSEPLDSRFSIDHSTLLYLLQRPGQAAEGYRDLLGLIDLSHEPSARKSMLRRKARMLFRSLWHADLIDLLPRRDGRRGQEVALADDLQHDFSIHHALSLFLVEILADLDPDHDDYHLLVTTFVEAILEDPSVVLMRQRDKERDKAYQQLKAEGAEYNELREKLDKITWPQPDADLVLQTFHAFASQHPWVTGFHPSPKSVARDMYERWTSFNQYVKEYGLERSEGVLLRYLNQAYKAMAQNIPEADKTERLHDVIAYLRGVITRTDSSLVEEWENLHEPEHGQTGPPPEPKPLDHDPTAFRARVRAELMEVVAALARKEYEEAAELLRPAPTAWTPQELEEVLAPFYADYDAIVFDHHARAHSLGRIERTGPGQWTVIQVLCDPAGDDMWFLKGRVDLWELTDREGRLFALERIDC